MLNQKISALRDADVSLPRMKREAAVTVLILYAVLTAAAAALPGVTLRLAASAAAAAFLASALYMYRRKALLFFPPAAAVIALTLSRGIPSFVFALLAPLFSGAAVSYNLLMKSDKSRTVAASSAAIAAAAAIAVPIYFLTGGKTFSYDSALASLTGFFGSLRSPAGKEIFTSDASLGLARYLLVVSPALVLIAVSAVSFAAATLSVWIAELFSFGGCLPEAARTYAPSAVSAGVYLLSYLVSAALISNTAADVIGYTAENLLIALLPAMMIHGGRTLFKLARRHEKTVLFAALTVIVFLLSPSIYLMFVSFSGACGRIYAEIKPSLRRFLRRVTGGDDDDDDNDNNDDDNDNDGRGG